VATSGSGSGTVSGGEIDCPGTCETSEWLGDTVTLTAAPDPGSTFTGWSGGSCGGTGECVVVFGGDEEVTAQFSKLPPPVNAALAVTVAGQGSVSGDGIACPGTCTVSKAAGWTATLTATPAAGWTFAGWSGAGCSGTGQCAVTMLADQEVGATFVPQSSGGGNQPPAGPSAPPPAGPTTNPKKPLKCKKGFVKKKKKGKVRCVKRKKHKQRG